VDDVADAADEAVDGWGVVAERAAALREVVCTNEPFLGDSDGGR
jgi:hypothetical protein